MPATDFNKLSKELSGSTGILGSLLLFVIIALPPLRLKILLVPCSWVSL